MLIDFRDREKEGERMGEKSQYVREISRVVSYTLPSMDLAHNPGMCTDWELNPRPFSLWDNALTN